MSSSHSGLEHEYVRPPKREGEDGWCPAQGEQFDQWQIKPWGLQGSDSPS